MTKDGQQDADTSALADGGTETSDRFRWFDPTGEKAHLVPVGEPNTLCGLSVDGDQEPARLHLGAPVAYNRGACDSCRASFARDQLATADVDVDAIQEGDGVVFWDGGDPTDPSEHPLRRSGIVEEIPPYKMFEGTRKDTVEIADQFQVRVGPMTLTGVPLGRVYTHVPDPEDPDAFMSGGIGSAIAGAVNEAIGGTDE